MATNYINPDEAYIKYGLKVPENFLISVEYICKRGGKAVYLEEVEAGPQHWCVYYGGAGHYFTTREAALHYLSVRKFNKVRTPKYLNL